MSVITKMTLESSLITIDLPVSTAQPTDRYILRGVDGLGPPEINISMGNALYQGGVYRGSQPADREIVIKLSLNPAYGAAPSSPDKLRAFLYSNLAGQFSSRFSIFSLTYDDDIPQLPPEMYVHGYVRSIAITPFEKDSVVQVVLRCPEPWFKDVEETIVDPLPDVFLYEGSAPTGYVHQFVINETVSSFHIQAESNVSKYETIKLSYDFHDGDLIEYCSIPGFRAIKLIRAPDVDGIEISGFCNISNNIWPSLRPGNNIIRVYKQTFDDPLLKTDAGFHYTKQYWGV